MTEPSDDRARARAWQRMLSGRRLDLLDPSPSDVAIEDVAHGLARVARWNGQTVGTHAFSVAQHALVVEEILTALDPGTDRRWRLAALLHDAPEYVIGDLISPFKAAVGLDYKAFEIRLLKAIHMSVGLPPELPATVTAAIKTADRIAAYFEATQLAGFSAEEADRYFGRPQALPPTIITRLSNLSGLPTAEAQAAFLAAFKALSATAAE
jgi:5'-deoxynucleotidase YfbR-like HD superfamily hydrolase